MMKQLIGVLGQDSNPRPPLYSVVKLVKTSTTKIAGGSGFESCWRMPHNFFYHRGWESTEHTVLTNLRREGQEIINLNLPSPTQVTSSLIVGIGEFLGMSNMHQSH